jgi:hypothetical protein
LARREDDPEDPLALKFVSVVRLQFRSGKSEFVARHFSRKKIKLSILFVFLIDFLAKTWAGMGMRILIRFFFIYFHRSI